MYSLWQREPCGTRRSTVYRTETALQALRAHAGARTAVHARAGTLQLNLHQPPSRAALLPRAVGRDGSPFGHGDDPLAQVPTPLPRATVPEKGSVCVQACDTKGQGAAQRDGGAAVKATRAKRVRCASSMGQSGDGAEDGRSGFTITTKAGRAGREKKKKTCDPRAAPSSVASIAKARGARWSRRRRSAPFLYRDTPALTSDQR